MGNVAPAGASAEEIAEHLTVARVELERRRIDKRGKVKTKLSVVGVRCVDCSVSHSTSTYTAKKEQTNVSIERSTDLYVEVQSGRFRCRALELSTHVSFTSLRR